MRKLTIKSIETRHYKLELREENMYYRIYTTKNGQTIRSAKIVGYRTADNIFETSLIGLVGN